MKKIILYILFLVSNLSFSQITLTKESQGKFNAIHNEKMFIHYNSNFLLTGESLKYKAYVLNSTTNVLSTISKIAYVELVGEGNESVFKQKLNLKDGQGYGDYLLTSSIKSGNYKLIGYTLWMKNQKQESFFIENITIINPFEEKLLPNTKENIQNNSIRSEKNEGLVSLNKREFKKREKGSLYIYDLIKTYPLGNYSISIRKFDTNTKNIKTSSLEFLKNKSSSQKKIKVGQEFFLPELRGNILYGTIENNNSENNISQIKVALSITGKNNYSKIVETNNKGEFFINLNDTFENTKAFIQIVDNSKENYSLAIRDLTKNEYKNLAFKAVESNKNIDSLIQQRSVYNQIENAYIEYKQDAVIVNKNYPQDFKNRAIAYNLDDYTRFNSMKDIFIEIIKNSTVREKNGKYTFYVTGNQRESEYNALPLLLIDGLITQDHNDFYNINAKSIKTIWVYKDLYNFGSKIYQGVIAVDTFKSDYSDEIIYYEDHQKIINLFKPQPDKKYFTQQYSDNSLDKVPDFRHQLFWNPNLNSSKESAEITFFTSDNTGLYEISIEGFSGVGKPISIKKYFKVE